MTIYVQHVMYYSGISESRTLWDRLFVLCEEVVLFERLKMHWNYREETSWGASSCVLCREAVLISEGPLSEISPFYFYMRCSLVT